MKIRVQIQAIYRHRAKKGGLQNDVISNPPASQIASMLDLVYQLLDHEKPARMSHNAKALESDVSLAVTDDSSSNDHTLLWSVTNQ